VLAALEFHHEPRQQRDPSRLRNRRRQIQRFGDLGQKGEGVLIDIAHWRHPRQQQGPAATRAQKRLVQAAHASPIGQQQAVVA